MNIDYFSSLKEDAKSRYLNKLKIIGLQECPYNLPTNIWLDDPTKWPEIEYPDIYEYLINTPGVYTKESMKSRKALESYNQFQSGWVGTVKHHITNSAGVIVLTANVMHSQALNKKKLNPWVAAQKDGSVICAHCDCMAGLAESCSHIGAILFKIEAAVRLGYTKDEACTDVPCKWNNDYVKKITGTKIRNINFYKPTTNLKKTLSPKKFKPATSAQQTQFLNMLSKIPQKDKPVGLSLFAGYCKDFVHKAPVPVTQHLPEPLRSYYQDGLSEEQIHQRIKDIHDTKLTKEPINYIEKSTILQSASLVWKSLRIGRITASVVHEVLHTNESYPAKSLVKKLCTEGPDLSHLPSVKWGCDNENNALSAYKLVLSKTHDNVIIEKSGLRLHETYNFLGASPDGQGTCGCHGKFLVEIKCPAKHKEKSTIEECNGDKYFCLNQDRKLKSSHKYYGQVQFRLLIFGLKMCHFVIWTPKFCYGVIVPFDEAFKNNIPKLVDFHKKHIASELVTRTIEKSYAADVDKEL